MENIERRVRREVRAMTRRDVITKVLARQLTWIQAAQVLDITPRQHANAVPAAAPHWRTRSRLSHFPARTPQAGEGAGGKMSISQTANSTPGGDSPCPAAPL